MRLALCMPIAMMLVTACASVAEREERLVEAHYAAFLTAQSNAPCGWTQAPDGPANTASDCPYIWPEGWIQYQARTFGHTAQILISPDGDGAISGYRLRFNDATGPESVGFRRWLSTEDTQNIMAAFAEARFCDLGPTIVLGDETALYQRGPDAGMICHQFISSTRHVEVMELSQHIFRLAQDEGQ